MQHIGDKTTSGKQSKYALRKDWEPQEEVPLYRVYKGGLDFSITLA